MPRAIRVLDAHHRDGRPLVDTVILDYAQRSSRAIAVVCVKGTRINIDLQEPARLRTDDLLLLDDGGLVEVVAASEPLVEARGADLASLAAIAWHLGDRHVLVQVFSNRIRAKRDAAVEALLKSLGAKVALIEAPFEPEGGAYESSHVHSHGDAHDQEGHHHDH
jgi:urease accessory protein